MAPQPPLFQPFRALGYITDDVPFAIQRRGREVYVTVSVGRCWQARPLPRQKWRIMSFMFVNCEEDEH